MIPHFHLVNPLIVPALARSSQSSAVSQGQELDALEYKTEALDASPAVISIEDTRMSTTAESGKKFVDDIAERIRQGMEATPLETQPALRVTVSIGVSQCVPGMTAHDVLRAADEAVYAAKRGGRNQVVVSTWRPDTAATRSMAC